MSRVSADDRTGDGKNEERAPGNGARNDPSRADDHVDEQRAQNKDESGEHQNEPKKPPIYERPVFWIVLGALLIVGLIVFLLWFFDWRYHVTTDDAFITAHNTTVSPRVAGHVEKVLVDDNQDVKKGDPLVTLDQRDFIQTVKSAQASQENATAQLAQANAQKASAMRKRWKPVAHRESAVTRSQSCAVLSGY